LIDIWHFVVQASLELNLTPDDILKEYERKNEINRQRQKDGY
jgi:dimeric dUTPase (all-alpha-NTP-PPase superfamily)